MTANPMTSFYIATGLERAPYATAIARILVLRGFRHTYDWAAHGSVQASPERWAEVALAEAAGVLDADFVVVLHPGGRGTHVELGLALAGAVLSRKRAYLVGYSEKAEARTCVFYHHPLVRRVQNVGDLLDLLERERHLP